MASQQSRADAVVMLSTLMAETNRARLLERWPQKLRLQLLLALLVGWSLPGVSAERPERAAILEATRPVASKLAGQPVRFRVDRLNQDRGWAVLVGELVGQAGRPIDWELAEGCHLDLDKMLWVVLRKAGSLWQVRHIEICAAEPPYWYLEQYGGLVWPCGVYAGLQADGSASLEQQCRAMEPKRSRAH
jgi:hypothetical protein